MKRIVFVMSDTGHGHRAASEAISTALKIRHGDAVQCEIIDVFKHYTPFPFCNFPEYYPQMIKRMAWFYGISYKFSNTPFRARLFTSILYVLSYPLLRQLPVDYTADAVVSTHSIITRPTLSIFDQSQEQQPSFFTVVVDLISTHMFWYDARSHLLMLPTDTAFDTGLKVGLQPDQMTVTGIPVHPRFIENIPNRSKARENLGWDADLPAVLLVGGGEGMGRLYDVAYQINQSQIPCQLAIITGRNHKLKQALDQVDWQYPTYVYGFVDNMYELMSAADVLVTKAGSLTISEACVVGLPMILYEAIPGQEEGNLQYVVQTQTGVYAPSTKTIVRRIRQFLEDPLQLALYASNAKNLGRPNAVWDIADHIWRGVSEKETN